MSFAEAIVLRWNALPRLAQIVSLATSLGILGGIFYGGYWFGSEMTNFIVGQKEKELFILRNELDEARRTLDAISDAPSEREALAGDVASGAAVNATTGDKSASEFGDPVAHGYACVSKELRILGLYSGEVVTTLTPQLKEASEKYRAYMVGLDPTWRQPPLDNVNAAHWCDRAADAFWNLKPFLDEFNVAVGMP